MRPNLLFDYNSDWIEISQKFWFFQWKEICTSKFVKNKRALFVFRENWKKTTLAAMFPSKIQFDVIPQRKRPLPGKLGRIIIAFSSKWFFFWRLEYFPVKFQKRQHRATIPIENFSKLDHAAIDKRSNLTFEQFRNEYEKPNKPVILTDAMDKWAAKQKWKSSNFEKKFR